MQSATKTNQSLYTFRHCCEPVDLGWAKTPNLCFCGNSTYIHNPIFSEQRDNWATPYKFNDYEGESFNKAFDEHTARSAELDQETGLYYYGAGYHAYRQAGYTPGIGIWLSVDPLSDNTPNVSPYAYCVNNPVRLVDPDGRDWFQNEVTGSVYFHNKLRKDDAGTGAMKGEGWKHMGENGMFTNGENPSSKNDNLLVANNVGNLSFDKGSNTLDAELMLDGGASAEGFMSNQGYDKMPKLADVNITESNQSFPEPHSPISIPISSEFIEKVHTWTCEKKESKSNYNTIGNYKRTKNNFDVLTMTSTEKRYERRLYDYSKNSGSMSGSTFNNMLKMGSDFFSTKYNSKKMK